MQVQDANDAQAMQAVRVLSLLGLSSGSRLTSFELGGEKKTKGAALTFVRCSGCFYTVFLANISLVSILCIMPMSSHLRVVFTEYACTLSTHQHTT
jgi:hypothetical protein